MSAALVALVACVAAASPRGVDVVFLPDAPGAPPLVVSVEQDGAKRSASWAFAGAVPSSGALVDDAGTSAALLPLPVAPRGASLLERDGALILGVDDAGDWQAPLKVLPPPKGVAAMPVPGERALRLVVHGTVDGPPTSAVLYGASVKLTGRAVVRRAQPGARAVVVAGPDVVDAPGTAVQDVSACSRTVPAALSVVDKVSLKLTASAPAVCAGAVAVVPVTGTRLDAKKDVAAAGVVVVR
jgi:hypothetical protein